MLLDVQSRAKTLTGSPLRHGVLRIDAELLVIQLVCDMMGP